jgi:hypothetical protein
MNVKLQSVKGEFEILRICILQEELRLQTDIPLASYETSAGCIIFCTSALLFPLDSKQARSFNMF